MAAWEVLVSISAGLGISGSDMSSLPWKEEHLAVLTNPNAASLVMILERFLIVLALTIGVSIALLAFGPLRRDERWAKPLVIILALGILVPQLLSWIGLGNPAPAIGVVCGLIVLARRQQMTSQELFKIEDYVAEVRVPEGSKAVGKSLDELEAATEDSDALVVGLIRGERSILGAAWRERIQAGDIVILESDQKGIDKFVGTLELELPSAKKKENEESEKPKTDPLHSGDGALMEAVIPPERSWLIGRTPESLKLRTRFGVNLLAASRQGLPHRGRLKSFRFRAGDVLLLQGEEDRLREVISRLGCLPLAERQLQFVKRNLALLSALVFGLAIASATLGILSLPIALASAATLMVLLNIVPAREMYDSIDWPVVVLIGAMIPIGQALEETGATKVVVESFLGIASGFSPMVILTLVLILTMMLSDVLNNAATAVVMAPFGWTLAQHLGVNPDPFLMAVAIGASCAFLTPIGHQNNLLVMGPGGYQFGDYWRMGLPLEILIVAVSIPTLLWVWPL